MLSGFILAKAYSGSLLSGAISWKEFLIKRITRIYPLHLITLLLYLPYYFYSMSSNGEEVIVGTFLKNLSINILLLQSFYPQIETYFNAPAWSISAVMFFYVMFPLLAHIVSSSRKLYFGGLTLLCAGLFVGLASADAITLSHYTFYTNPFTRLLDFAIGIALYAILKDLKLKVTTPVGTLLECCTIGVFVTFLVLHHKVANVYCYSVYYWPPAVLVISVIYFQKGLVSNILTSKSAVFLGNISFGFYLFHWMLIRYISGANHQLNITDNALLLVSFIFLITLLCSSISYLYFEKPIVRRVNSWLEHRFTLESKSVIYNNK
ncbi:acyltransferase family protein [Pontibacter brevis]